MLRAGIPMRDIDQTDLARYLRVLAFTAKRAEHDKEPEPRKPGGQVVELRRGSIEDFLGR